MGTHVGGAHAPRYTTHSHSQLRDGVLTALFTTGYYPEGAVGTKTNQQAQVDMIDEVLAWAGVTNVQQVRQHWFSSDNPPIISNVDPNVHRWWMWAVASEAALVTLHASTNAQRGALPSALCKLHEQMNCLLRWAWGTAAAFRYCLPRMQCAWLYGHMGAAEQRRRVCVCVWALANRPFGITGVMTQPHTGC